MNNESKKNGAGFTLIELIIFIGLSTGVLAVIALFVTNVGSLKNYFDESLLVDQEIQQTLAVMIPEIRSAAQSNIGNYPIEAASQTSFTFYSDIDRDGIFERVRYYLDGTTLKKGVIEPTGSPLTYNPANEVIYEAVHNMVTGYTIFNYYDMNYSGTQDPMATPVNIPNIRIIGITLTADQKNQTAGSAAITHSAKVAVRNLRDNS